MPIAMSKSIVAHDHAEVDTKIDQLMRDQNITSDEILQLGMVHFGANKFLITLLYWGTWMVSAAMQFGTKINFALSRTPVKPLLGLLSTITDIEGWKKTLSSSLLGLATPIINRGTGYSKATVSGFAAVIKASKQLWGGFVSEGLKVFMGRIFSLGSLQNSPMGFVSGVGYTLTHP